MNFKFFTLLLNKLRSRSQFFKGVLLLMTGTSVAQAIAVLMSPVLTRIYTPYDFGIFAAYSSICAVLFAFTSFAYEDTIILAKFNNSAFSLFLGCIFINCILLLLFLAIIYFFTDKIISLSNNTILPFVLYCLPFGFFLYGIFNPLIYWLNRQKKYRIIAKSSIVQSISNSVANLLMGFFLHFGYTGLILSQIFGQFAVIFYILKNKIFLNTKLSIKAIFVNLKKYQVQPKFMMPLHLLDVVCTRIPTYAIYFIYQNPYFLGQFALVERFYGIFSGIVGYSVSQNFFREFSELIREQKRIEAKKLLFKVWKYLFLLGITPYLIIFFFGCDIFRFVFGSDWRDAGKIAEILSFMFLFSFISSATSSGYLVLSMQKLSFYFVVFTIFGYCVIFFFIEDIFMSFKVLSCFQIMNVFLYNYILWRRI